MLVVSMCTQLTLEVHCEMKSELLEKMDNTTINASSKVHDYFDDLAHSREAWEPAFCGGMDVWSGVNVAFFTLEMLVRLMAGVKLFFCHRTFWRWNILDILLLFVAFLDVFRIEDLYPGMKAMNVLRMLRVASIFQYFPTVQNMVWSILACKSALASAIFLICVQTMMWSIFFMQIARYYVDRHIGQISPDDFKSIVTNWNGVFDSFMTLVYAVTGGADWQELAAPFLHMGGNYGSIWLTCFTLYVVFTTMGLLNVLVGIFVSQANNFTNVSIDAAIGQARGEMEESAHNANLLFDMIQAHAKKPGTKDGTPDLEGVAEDHNQVFLTTKQIRDACKDPNIQALYSHLDIDIIKPEQMVKSFDFNENGTVERGEFITGCMRLRGPAKPMEVQAILDLAIHIKTKLDDIDHRLVTSPVP